MRTVTVQLRADNVIGTTDPRLFGAFIEHLGRCVYGGIYEPGHPTADANGFRHDVLALVRELAPTIMRYPGGNFVSRLQLGRRRRTGRAAAAPARSCVAVDRDQSVRHQRIHRLVPRCRHRADAGRQPRHARRRCGAGACGILQPPGGTALSDLRRAHGWEQPHGVKFWCLGNEMDGPWQMEAKTAEEYGRVAIEAAKMMRWIDPSIELAACGSSGPHHADVRRMGRHGAGAQLRPCRVHLAAHLSEQLRRRHAGVPRQPRSDGQLHRGGGGDRRRGRGAAALRQAHHAEFR